MGIKCGIVGLPNIGKSTLFNALMQSSQAQAENYPFCTIDPNIGVVEVPDSRLNTLAKMVSPARVIPATIEFVDIAGLVEGASKGEGLGNRFLAHIREVNAIAHVVRTFENENVMHVSNRVDPVDDMATINLELIMADLQTAENALQKAYKNRKAGDRKQIDLAKLLEIIKTHLEQGHMLHILALTQQQYLQIAPLCFLTIKPMFYIANVSDNALEPNKMLDDIRRITDREATEVVPICASLEQEMSELEDEDASLFLAEMGFDEPGLERVIRVAYRLLGLQTFFTAGPQEVRAWTITKGAAAPAAAGTIHSDFERGFICAETISYADYISCNGEQGARSAGKLRQEGRDYIVDDGDVVHFRFNI